MSQSLVVVCTGHGDSRGYTEYVFRCRHEGGCEWTVPIRYAELSDLHERLGAVFSLSALPTFPPKAGFFGGLVGSRRDLVQERSEAFQRYFDILCDHSDMVRTACFQATFGVQPPEPVRHLRVRRWFFVPSEGATRIAGAMLDIKPEGQEVESSALVESYHLVARVATRASGEQGEVVYQRVAELQVPAKEVESQGARLVGLPLESEVEFEVRALNAMGRSPPVAIRALVPAQLPDEPASTSSPVLGPATPCNGMTDLQQELEHMAGTLEEKEQEVVDLQFDIVRLRSKLESEDRPGSKDASAVVVDEALHTELARKKEQIEEQERELARKQAEAKRVEEERQREMAAFRQQQADFQSERLEFERIKTSSPPGSPPPSSPRDTAAQEELEAELRSLKEELRKEREELQLQREEQQAAAAAFQKSSAERTERLHAHEMNLERQQLNSDSSQEQQQAQTREQQVELKQEKEELARLAAAEEESRRRQSVDLRRQEDELLARAEQLAQLEEQLQHERSRLQTSRQKLAVVQAHALSMLEKSSPNGTVHSLALTPMTGSATGLADEDVDEEEEEDDANRGGRNDVWTMDWSTIEQPKCEPCS